MTPEEKIAVLENRVAALERWNFHGQEEVYLTKWDKKQKEKEHERINCSCGNSTDLG